MKLFKTAQSKIFCVSIQRTGTTSVGEFFKHNGFKVADWSCSRKNDWSFLWEKGDFEAIFDSNDFIFNQVYEDDPWWFPEFYKVLYHRFPGSKFILFTRDSDKWFKSMLSHSEGKTLGNTKRHCKIYRREDEFFKLFNENERLNYNEKIIDNLLALEGHKTHYKNIYEIRNKEISEFFMKNAPNSLFKCELEDPKKWERLADFIGLKIEPNFDVHANKSKL